MFLRKTEYLLSLTKLRFFREEVIATQRGTARGKRLLMILGEKRRIENCIIPTCINWMMMVHSCSTGCRLRVKRI